MLSSFKEIKEDISAHFKYLYTKAGATNSDEIESTVENITQNISTKDSESLTEEIMEKEVSNVIKQLNLDKARGPNGF